MWKTPLNSPQSVSIYKNVLEPLLIPECPDLPNLPDPPTPIQKPVVQIEVIHLVHENKPVGGETGIEKDAGPLAKHLSLFYQKWGEGAGLETSCPD